jgi:hypothetical protein
METPKQAWHEFTNTLACFKEYGCLAINERLRNAQERLERYFDEAMDIDFGDLEDDI